MTPLPTKNILLSVILASICVLLFTGCESSTLIGTEAYGKITYFQDSTIIIGDKIIALDYKPLTIYLLDGTIYNISYTESHSGMHMKVTNNNSNTTGQLKIDTNKNFYLYSVAPYHGGEKQYPITRYELKEAPNR
jgi:hypothetical protein